MLRKLLLLLSLCLLPVNASVYEDATIGNQNIFLYIYTKDCSMCKKFSPFFDTFAEKHKEFKYVKADAHTLDGAKLMRKYGVRYVPFIVLTNPQAKKNVVINPYCSVDEICLERALKGFKGRG